MAVGLSRMAAGFSCAALLVLRCAQAATISPSALRKVRLLDLSEQLTAYGDAWTLQQQLVNYHMGLQSAAVGRGSEGAAEYSGTLVALQHKPVYTLGSGTAEGSGPFSFTARDGSRLEYETHNVERAGQATYHGPGQLVLYPILDLHYWNRDINWYLRALEDVAIGALDCYRIHGERRGEEGHTGVWVGDSKVAALGIKISRWVTMHGMSLNVCPDMRYFDNIVPCGISDKAVGSIATLGGPGVAMGECTAKVLDIFAEKFSVQFTTFRRADLLL